MDNKNNIQLSIKIPKEKINPTDKGYEIVKIDVSPDDTVKYLRGRSAEYVVIEVERVQLTCGLSRGTTVLYDRKDQYDEQFKGALNENVEIEKDDTPTKLSDYDIKNGTLIEVMIMNQEASLDSQSTTISKTILTENADNGFSVIVKNLTGRTEIITVYPDETISKLKEKIFDRTGIAKENIGLTYRGKKLQDSLVLGDKIKPDSSLQLVIKTKDNTTLPSNNHSISTDPKTTINNNPEPKKFKIKTLSGQIYEINNIDENTTIRDLRAKVAEKIGQTIDQVRLIYLAKDLGLINNIGTTYNSNNTAEFKTLKEYRITNDIIVSQGVIVYAVLKLRDYDVISSNREPADSPSKKYFLSPESSKKLKTVLLILLAIMFFPITILLLCCACCYNCCCADDNTEQQPNPQLTDQQRSGARVPTKS